RAVLGFRAESMGLLVSGSSMANLTGLAVARYAAGQKVGVDVRARGLQTSGDGPRFVVYASREGHSSIRKAIELLGIGLDGYRALMEHDLALADRLAAQIEAAPDLELLARGLSAGLLPARATGARDSGRPIGRV